jgi:hypothetical protein
VLRASARLNRLFGLHRRVKIGIGGNPVNGSNLEEPGAAQAFRGQGIQRRPCPSSAAKADRVMGGTRNRRLLSL